MKTFIEMLVLTYFIKNNKIIYFNCNNSSIAISTTDNY